MISRYITSFSPDSGKHHIWDPRCEQAVICYGAYGVQTYISRNKDDVKLRGKPAVEPCQQENISALRVSKVFTEELAQTLTPGLLVTFLLSQRKPCWQQSGVP